MMKRVLLLATVLLTAAATNVTQAQTGVEDPLHGCTTAGCSEANIGGDAVTPINPFANFGFFASPPQSGDLELKFLIPDNFGVAAAQAFATSVSVTGTSSSGLTLFSTTPWTSGNLESDYLGITSFANGSPPNPLSAWLGATQTIDPTATGYFVVLADMGQYSLPTPGGTLPDHFNLRVRFETHTDRARRRTRSMTEAE